jgi:signal transduction histidine kinase
MNHELRTPLNGVLGLAQVLASDPEQGERQRRQAATLEQAGRHLLAILSEVLDLSRIESGRLRLSPRPVVLAELLQETLALAQGDAVSKHINLALRAASDLPDTVPANRDRSRYWMPLRIKTDHGCRSDTCCGYALDRRLRLSRPEAAGEAGTAGAAAAVADAVD